MVLRLLKRKRVPILSGDDEWDEDDYVDIPTIFEMEITGSRGQVFRYRFRNDSGTQSRTVSVKKVGGATGSFAEANVEESFDFYVNAERIRIMAFRGALDDGKAWQTNKKLKNLDPAPKQPDGSDSPRHLRVHYVRFCRDNDPDESRWIDVEYIDELEMRGSLAQDYGFRFRHPTAEQYAELANDGQFGQTLDDGDPYMPMLGFCDPSLELMDVEINDDTGKTLPVRLDPLQNIVNVNAFPKAYWFTHEDSGIMWASADGENWQSFQGPFNGGFINLVYGNGMWVAYGLEYSGDEVFVNGIVCKSTNLFDWELVTREGPSGGLISQVHYISNEEDPNFNRFEIVITGRYQQVEPFIKEYVDCPFPPNSFGGATFSVNTPPPPNDYPTVGSGTKWLQMRGTDSESEIWFSDDEGETWKLVAGPTTFKTCDALWGFDIGLIGDEPGAKFGPGGPGPNAGNAPSPVTPLIPVGTYDRTDMAPPLRWSVNYFTQAFDAGIGMAGAGIHVTRWGDGTLAETDTQAQLMIQDIQDANSIFWLREYSGGPSGGNYLEFCAEGTYGDGTDRPNQAMIDQCLAGFQFARNNPQLFVANGFDNEVGAIKYEFPSIGGFYPLG